MEHLVVVTTTQRKQASEPASRRRGRRCLASFGLSRSVSVALPLSLWMHLRVFVRALRALPPSPELRRFDCSLHFVSQTGAAAVQWLCEGDSISLFYTTEV